MTDRKAKQTPLPDLLDRVPDDIVLGIPGNEPMFPSYTNIPLGKLARQAAAELRRLAAVETQRDALLEALRAAVADWDEEVSRGRWLDAARAAIKKAEEA